MKKVKIYSGAEGIKEVYEMALQAKSIDIVCLSSAYAEVIDDYFDRDFAPRLYNSKINTREILPDSEENREYAKNKDQAKNQVRFLKNKRPSESDMMTFEDKVILVSYNKEEPFALVIADQDLSISFQNQFTGRPVVRAPGPGPLSDVCVPAQAHSGGLRRGITGYRDPGNLCDVPGFL